MDMVDYLGGSNVKWLKFEIEINTCLFDTNVYEPVRWDIPVCGEYYINREGEVSECRGGYCNYTLILRKKWQAPAWLRTGYVWQNKSGFWWWSNLCPELAEERWRIVGPHKAVCLSNLRFDPPVCGDWTKSLRPVP